MKNPLAVLAFLSTAFAWAQHSPGTPPSPGNLQQTSLSEANYVDLTTGRVNIPIPITEVTAGELTVPISLLYSSSGRKIEEISSWVGNGWDLVAGGVITRTVADFPDDVSVPLNTGYGVFREGMGIMHTTALQDIKSLEYTDPETEPSSKISNIYNNHYDSQPDIFHIILNGEIVSFVFDENNFIQTLENQNYKISATLSSSGLIEKFVVFDQRGVKYEFEDKDVTTEYTAFRTPNADINMRIGMRYIDYYSAWHLTKITVPGDQVILFEYRNETVKYALRKAEYNPICIIPFNCSAFPTASFDADQDAVIETDIKVIENITSPCEKITFRALSTPRNDLEGSHLLSSITKRSVNSTFEEVYELDISYRVSPGTVQSYVSYTPQLNGIYYNRTKLFTFTYNQTSFTKRTSAQQDFWGYYNGNGSNKLTPTIYWYTNRPNRSSFYLQNTTQTPVTLSGADRSSSLTHSQAGLLTEFTNKAGQVTSFEYELNKFVYDNVEFTGNGVRVKAIEFKSVGEYTYRKEYQYEQNSEINGFVSMMPCFSFYNEKRSVTFLDTSDHLKIQLPWTQYRLYFVAIPPSTFPVPQYVEDWDNFTPWDNALRAYYQTSRFSIPLGPSRDYQVSYLHINESFGNMLTTYNFSRNTIESDLPLNTELHNNATHKARLPQYINGYAIDYHVDKDYPFVPEYIRSWKKVTPQSILHYTDAGATLVSKDEFIYEVLTRNQDPALANKVFGLKYDFLQITNYAFTPSVAVAQPLVNYLICYSKYPIIIEAEKKLLQHKHTVFNSGEAFEDITDYEYQIGLVTSVKNTNSKGTVTWKQIKYPHNLKYSNTSVLDPFGERNLYKKMVDKNLFNFPVEVTTRVDGKVVSSELKPYANFDGFYAVEKNMTLDMGKPLANFQPALPNYLGDFENIPITFDSRYRENTINLRYDNKGNVCEIVKKDGIHSVFLYGYDKTRLVAKIENASFAESPGAFETASANIDMLSHEDSDNCRFSYCDEQALREYLMSLRSLFPNAMVTTYTYDSLAGLTSSTDPKGETIFYNYDDFQRLKSVLDRNGNIIKEHQYNYKNDQP